ncbi:MAG: CopD family protein [Cyclobacteriaceae bacterium]
MFLYLKALHIIFVVTWFAGLFYVVRLFIYNREAHDKPEIERKILQAQFEVMIRRLWFGITWPSCVLSMILGIALLSYYPVFPTWLWVKLGFVVGLLAYHGSLHKLFRQQMKGVFGYSSQQLRIWNEVASIFLIAIVMLVVVRTGISALWGMVVLMAIALLLITAIYLYKRLRG